ncbi:hypothetical protein ETU10_06900 [Apibacter muscae]|uniref:hypothetical protein n=1 Tax=Apibacter muscae TaxID=2509004 RepID=UPI0011AC614B|nr:hypothetical protein [Apibacter muscae]TWP23451.1 hypothetical protein ETU10_06900 [Apibacter muscae]
MGFLRNLFRNEVSSVSAIPEVQGRLKKTYNYVYERRQWLRGQSMKHKVEGIIQAAISPYSKNYTKWEIYFKDVNLRKTSNFVLEYYILWDFVRRANFYMSTNGKITTHEFDAFGQKEIFKEKQEKIYQYLREGTRRDAIEKVIKGVNQNSILLARTLKANPIIQLLAKEFSFFQENLLQNTHQLPVFSFNSNEIMEDYFGAGKHLPLKKFSSLNLSLKDATIGSSVNGWNKEEIDTGNFFRFMKQLAGKIQIGRELLVDSSEYYKYAPTDFFNQRKLLEAESYTQTVVAEAWFLEEQTSLTLIEEDYGS